MVQAMAQGGSPTNPWKHGLVTGYTCATRSDYLDANSDEALLDLIDPTRARFSEQLKHHLGNIAEVETVYDYLEKPACQTFVSDKRHEKVSDELIAERFGIGPIGAQKTQRATTQRGGITGILPISRRYRADCVFDFRQLNGKFSTDTAYYEKLRPLRGHVGSQLYSHMYRGLV